jgi:hypothetical protein
MTTMSELLTEENEKGLIVICISSTTVGYID